MKLVYKIPTQYPSQYLFKGFQVQVRHPVIIGWVEPRA